MLLTLFLFFALTYLFFQYILQFLHCNGTSTLADDEDVVKIEKHSLRKTKINQQDHFFVLTKIAMLCL
jgi:hypothetical protein